MPDGLSALDRSEVLACDGRSAHHVAGWFAGFYLQPISACPWEPLTFQRMMWGAGYFMGRDMRFRTAREHVARHAPAGRR